MKNECENMTLYFYGELEPQQAAAFQEHLAHCPHCQREMAFLQQTQQALVPPAAPEQVVQGALAPALAGKGWWRRVFKPALATALVLGAGVFLFISGPFGSRFDDDGQEWMAYISAEADEEYNSFVADFEAFEAKF